MKETKIILLVFLCILTFVNVAYTQPTSPLPDSIRSFFYFPKKVNPTAVPVKTQTVNPQAPVNVTFQQPEPPLIPNQLVTPNFPNQSMPAPQVGNHLVKLVHMHGFVGTTPTLPALGTSFSTSSCVMPQDGMGILFQGSSAGGAN